MGLVGLNEWCDTNGIIGTFGSRIGNRNIIGISDKIPEPSRTILTESEWEYN